MDNEVLKILNESNCLEHYSNFKGIRMAELRTLTPLELKSKLMTLLSSAIDVDAIASEIARSSVKTVKSEPTDVKPNVAELSHSTMRDDDDEPLIVHEVPGDVNFVSVNIKAEDPVVEVTIDDDDESMAEPSDSGSSDWDYNSEEPKLDLPKLAFLPTPLTIDEIGKGQPTYIHFCGRDMGHYSLDEPPAKRRKLKLVGSGPVDTRSDSAGTDTEHSGSLRFVAIEPRAKWRALYSACGRGKIKILDCDQWEWGPLDASSPSNLYPLLSQHGQNLSELTFCSNVTLPSTFSGHLTLPNLKVIKIQNFEDVFAFSSVLSDIIKATTIGRLEKLEFTSGNAKSVRPFLESLGSASGPQSGLYGLKSLTILSKCSNNSLLVLSNDDFKILKSLNCHDIRDLYLDCSLSDNVQGPFESFLKTVPKLKRLILSGCFRSDAVRKPRVKLVFPVLRALHTLELGRTAIRDSPCDDLLSRPAKRAGRRLMRQFRVENEGQDQDRRVAVTEEFPVTVFLPILPSLKQLHFGRFFEFDELYFQSWPSLRLFYVGSPWHLALRLPVESNRNRTFSNITALQLPDQLEDDDFVRTVLPQFPNIRILSMNLPTVKVIRAVSFALKSVKTLIYLGLRTQFDFASSLDACFVEKPSELVLSEYEVKAVKTLKEYRYWKEYVDFHGIEVPNSGIQVPNPGIEFVNSGVEGTNSIIGVDNPGIDVPNSGVEGLNSIIGVANPATELPNSGVEGPNSIIGVASPGIGVANSGTNELDDDTKYAGLVALEKTVLNKKRFVLEMWYVVRRLRLPKGDFHWDDDRCAFGDTLIGFQQFPVSPTVEKASQFSEITFLKFENKVYKVPEGFQIMEPSRLGVNAGTQHSWASRRVKEMTE